MNKRIFSLLAVFIALSAGLHAEFKMDSLLAKTAADLKHAPAIVARATVKSPKFLVDIVSTTVTSFPDQAVKIVEAVLLAQPDRFEDTLQAAILAQPKLAVKITTMAADTLPEHLEEIIKIAEASVPEDMRASIAAIGQNAGGDAEHHHAGGEHRDDRFPEQPIRPDVVSPSH